MKKEVLIICLFSILLLQTSASFVNSSVIINSSVKTGHIYPILGQYADFSLGQYTYNSTCTSVAAESRQCATSVTKNSLGLTVGTTDSVESCLDPARAYDYFAWDVIRSLGSGLVEYKVNGTANPGDFAPGLATSWTVSNDALIWTFNLRHGVKYDDGTEFNATHVKYTFDRGIGIADPDGPFMGIGYGDIIENVTVVNKYIVSFNLKLPFSPFLSLLACPASFIVDPAHAPMTEVVVYVSGNPRASHPMGLGLYNLKNWTRIGGKDYEIDFEANPNYWNASGGIPKAHAINIKFFSDSTALAQAITSQTIDVAYRQLSLTDIKNMRNMPDLQVWEGPGGFIQYLVLQEKYAPFNSKPIRQAIAAAINRTMLVETVFLNEALKLHSLIPNGMFAHDDAFLKLGDPNYTRTKELLAPLGYNQTHKLTFTLWYETSGHYPQSAQQAQVLKSSLEASGVITANLDGLDWPAYRTARQNEAMQAFIMGWVPDYIDPDNYIYPFLDSQAGSWLHDNYADPQMDQLIGWTRGNASAETRENLYSQIQYLSVTDAPIIPLYQSLAFAVSRREITGICLDIAQTFRYWQISTRTTLLDFSLTPNPAYVGQQVTLGGTLTTLYGQAIGNATVEVSYSTNGGANWTYAGFTVTNVSGFFGSKGTITSAGSYLVKANYNGSAIYNPSDHTEALPVYPKLDTKISFTLAPNPAKVGQTVAMLGNLTDISNNTIENAPLEMYLKIGNGSWQYAATIYTNSTGWFSVGGKVTSTGTYQIAVLYRGSYKYNLSYHIETLVVNPLSRS
jgi:peptide/nickel transport system substrate-binding protein